MVFSSPDVIFAPCAPHAATAEQRIRRYLHLHWLGEAVTSNDKKRVLIVDDEHIIADSLVIIFSNAGYESRAAYSAEEALELIPSWQPHFAIVDVILPAMNGIDFAMLLKAISPGCTVQLFSGQMGTDYLLETTRHHGNAFEVLAKPVHPTEFLAIASALFPPGGVVN